MKARRTIAVSAVLALVSLTGFAAPGSAQDKQEVAGVEREGYFTRPATSATPPVLVDGFPPSNVCLVAGIVGLPQLCGPEISGTANDLGLSGGIPVPETIDADLVQPVAPDTMPVGMAGGEERYVSALQFDLPRLEDGQQFGSFELLMRPDGLGFAVESPGFRKAVLAVISQVGDQDPQAFIDDLTAILQDEETPVIAQTITGIEACPATESWDGRRAQNGGIDGSRIPDRDCLIGTTGSFDESNSSWTFDLTFAAQAWSTGGITGETLPNEGILLRPLGAENLAYGDPDLSTNWLVSLAGAEAADDLRPRIRYTIVEDFAPPVEVVEPITPTPDLGPTPVVPDVAGPDLGPLPQPDVATPSPPANVTSGAISARYAERAASSTDFSTPWMLLLLIPIGLAGAWMLGEALIAGPAATGHRQGALDELVRRQGDLS